MAEIREIIPQTQNKFLNMYEFRGKNKAGNDFRYFTASRAEREEDLKAVTGENHPDGVIIYAVYRGEGADAGRSGDSESPVCAPVCGESRDAEGARTGNKKSCAAGAEDRVVLIREFRIPIGCYVYGFPAGLVEKGEDFHTAAIREMHEETGLVLSPLEADEIYEEPRFTSSGLTDESCAMVYGYASGEPSERFLEESEDIQIVLADREEARRILREERVALMCAYHLLYFIAEDDPFAFLQLPAAGAQEEQPKDMVQPQSSLERQISCGEVKLSASPEHERPYKERLLSGGAQELPDKERLLSGEEQERPDKERLLSGGAQELPDKERLLSGEEQERPYKERLLSGEAQELPSSGRLLKGEEGDILKWIARAEEKKDASRPKAGSAVLIPILSRNGALHVLYEVRAAALRTQPGEVCFPGGRIEPGEDPREAAIREATEELLIGRDQIEIAGAIDGSDLAPGGGTLHAFIGFVHDYEGTWSRDEVDRVFTTPLDWILENDPKVYKLKLTHQIPEDFPHEAVPGGRSYKWKERFSNIPFYFGMPRVSAEDPGRPDPSDDPVLWGATARVTDRFARYLRSGREEC